MPPMAEPPLLLLPPEEPPLSPLDEQPPLSTQVLPASKLIAMSLDFFISNLQMRAAVSLAR